MNEGNIEIVIPEECKRLDQNEEWVEFVTDSEACKVRLHEYGRFFEIPGLYDEFYKNLKCQSPQVVSDALQEQILQSGQDGQPLRILDFGAGNGQVGEQLTRKLNCEAVVGLDIIPEAREAAKRDRPGVYDEYYVLNMADPADQHVEELSHWDFNALVTVAALGFGDISTRAFINAYNLVGEDAWVAFNIKDRFLSDTDETGFAETVQALMTDGFELIESRRYRHRVSLAGEDLHYYSIVGRKTKDITIS